MSLQWAAKHLGSGEAVCDRLPPPGYQALSPSRWQCADGHTSTKNGSGSLWSNGQHV